jgi:Skp family chaperone for outer membrane proteins
VGSALVVLAAVAVALGAVLTLALKALSEAHGRIDAERRYGEQKSRADMLDVNVTSVVANLAEEKARADRLTAANSKLLAEIASLPAGGSYQRLLQIIAEAHDPNGGHGPLAVPAAVEAKPGDDTTLLAPGGD